MAEARARGLAPRRGAGGGEPRGRRARDPPLVRARAARRALHVVATRRRPAGPDVPRRRRAAAGAPAGRRDPGRPGGPVGPRARRGDGAPEGDRGAPGDRARPPPPVVAPPRRSGDRRGAARLAADPRSVPAGAVPSARLSGQTSMITGRITGLRCVTSLK